MSHFDWPPTGNSRLVHGNARLPVAAISGPRSVRINKWVENTGSVRRMIIEVGGDVNEETGPHLLSNLTRTIIGESEVCCDLSGVGFFGATGADILAIAHVTAAVTRGSFTVRGVHGATAQVLECTGLDRILVVLR